jgi:diaminohydroxyphosphoribosylaminopyrimidine deaminase / 5-amino-6-(5-phosphoribosylamino)uracil reductase
MTTDERYMERCIELALKGIGKVSPNPLVGCVIVKNGKIIAEGWHKEYGGNHAERNAINSALRKGISLKGAELYVNLEPCSHYGLTPPCASLAAEHKFKRVIIGVKDPYYKVAGKGIKILQKAGIKVKVGVLEQECRDINKFFFKYVKTGLPYITIKTAQTLDGKIANDKFESKWISSLASRKLVHKMRAAYDAVLVGMNTVKYDNPELTVRLTKGRNPVRIVIDPFLQTDLKSSIYNTKAADTIVITSHLASNTKKSKFEKHGVIVMPCKSKNGIVDIKEAVIKLGALGLTSIMVEGGAKTYYELIKQCLVDEFMIFIAPKIMGKGISAFTEKFAPLEKSEIEYYKVNTDVLINIKINN